MSLQVEEELPDSREDVEGIEPWSFSVDGCSGASPGRPEEEEMLQHLRIDSLRCNW